MIEDGGMVWDPSVSLLLYATCRVPVYSTYLSCLLRMRSRDRVAAHLMFTSWSGSVYVHVTVSRFDRPSTNAVVIARRGVGRRQTQLRYALQSHCRQCQHILP